MSLRAVLAVIATVSCLALGLAATASAEPANPNPQSGCTADGNAGNTNIVFKDVILVLTGCHSGSTADGTTVVNSGSCHGAINEQRENIICTKQ